MGVSPFGNPRIEAYLQLPAAYRSLSRPSSAPDAKAFTLCSCSLELFAKDLFFSCFVPLNCLSFFVHFSSCSKKALAFSPFHFLLAFFTLVEIVFYPTLLKDQYFLNIMSSISVRFYSFSFIRFSMIMVLPEPSVISFSFVLSSHRVIPKRSPKSPRDFWPPALPAYTSNRL